MSEVGWKVPPSGQAAELVANPYLQGLLNDLEKQAFERAASASFGDDQQRLEAMMAVKTLRSLRRKLDVLAEGQAKPPQRGRPA